VKLLLALALVFGSTDDGWVTWRVEAGQDVGHWCCSTWSAGKATSTACRLDGGGLTMNSDDPGFQSTGEMQIYVKLENGRATKIRTLSPQCPVESAAAVRDLGLLDADESLDWLQQQVGANARLSSDALLAISAHRSPQAVQRLVAAIENPDLGKKVREEALFWLVNQGSDEAYAWLDQLLTRR
jgi:hypothetical protein